MMGHVSIVKFKRQELALLILENLAAFLRKRDIPWKP
jgi:hypothetical protein